MDWFSSDLDMWRCQWNNRHVNEPNCWFDGRVWTSLTHSSWSSTCASGLNAAVSLSWPSTRPRTKCLRCSPVSLSSPRVDWCTPAGAGRCCLTSPLSNSRAPPTRILLTITVWFIIVIQWTWPMFVTWIPTLFSPRLSLEKSEIIEILSSLRSL